MPYPNDPILRLRNRMRATLVVGIVAVIVCATWALSSTPYSGVPATHFALDQTPSSVSTQNSAAIDANAFARARLWNPKETPQAVTPPQVVQAQPLRLQLIGIIHEDGQLLAALYDPDEDRMLIVTSGQTVKGHEITAITAKTVELSSGELKHELRLEEAAS